MAGSGLTIKVIDRDRGWNNIARGVASIAGAEVKAGLVGEKAEAIHQDSELSVAQIGAIHEFGAPSRNIPERSFIRSTFSRNRGKYDSLLTNLAKAVFSGKSKPSSALELLGATMASDIKATIRAGIPPPLAPATIARRSKRKKDREIPLIDTRQLINAISFAVQIPNASKGALAQVLSSRAADSRLASLLGRSGLQDFSDMFAAPDLSSLR